jgi:hypothetical protein
MLSRPAKTNAARRAAETRCTFAAACVENRRRIRAEEKAAAHERARQIRDIADMSRDPDPEIQAQAAHLVGQIQPWAGDYAEAARTLARLRAWADDDGVC